MHCPLSLKITVVLLEVGLRLEVRKKNMKTWKYGRKESSGGGGERHDDDNIHTHELY